jgi:hypothetical protein
MKATNISHTVPSAKPVSAQRIESTGRGATSRSVVARVIPISPAVAPGIGSVIRLTITARNTAK